ILGKMLLHLEEVDIIQDSTDYIFLVIWQIRLSRHNRIQLLIGAIDRIAASLPRSIIQIVRWNEAEQLTHHRQTLGVILSHEMCHAGSLVVRVSAAKLILSDLLVRDRLNHIRPGY